jgi:hypothetical protein
MKSRPFSSQKKSQSFLHPIWNKLQWPKNFTFFDLKKIMEFKSLKTIFVKRNIYGTGKSKENQKMKNFRSLVFHFLSMKKLLFWNYRTRFFSSINFENISIKWAQSTLTWNKKFRIFWTKIWNQFLINKFWTEIIHNLKRKMFCSLK